MDVLVYLLPELLVLLDLRLEFVAQFAMLLLLGGHLHVDAVVVTLQELDLLVLGRLHLVVLFLQVHYLVAKFLY